MDSVLQSLLIDSLPLGDVTRDHGDVDVDVVSPTVAGYCRTLLIDGRPTASLQT